jgi:hypothetical protein
MIAKTKNAIFIVQIDDFVRFFLDADLKRNIYIVYQDVWLFDTHRQKRHGIYQPLGVCLTQVNPH